MAEIFPKRGEIYSVNFGGNGSREIKKTRPALVVQNDLGNQYAPTTIVVAIHRADEKKSLPVCVVAKKGTGGLNKNSVIDTGHLLTIDKRRLLERWGKVPLLLQEKVNEALKVSLDLK